MKKIGLFGVTGNPPHLGHLRVVEEALKKCDEVWVTPVFIHPFNKSFIEYTKRLEMLKLMFANLSNVKVLELDKEFYEMNQKTPYSYELLKFVSEKNNEVSPVLIIGEDNYKKEVWEKFYSHNEIEREFGVIAVKDFGMHSTQVRDYCKNSNWKKVTEVCGSLISKYVQENHIYCN